MSKTTTTTTKSATTTPRIATTTRPAAGSKPAVTVTPAAEDSKPATTTTAKPEKVRKSRKAQALIRLSKAIKVVERLQKLFPHSDAGEDKPCVLVETALQNLGDLKAYVVALPDSWKAHVKAPKVDSDIHVGDSVGLKDNAKVKAIYGDTILASELDDMVAEKVGTKLVKCVTTVSKAVVFISLKHLSKKPALPPAIEDKVKTEVAAILSK